MGDIFIFFGEDVGVVKAACDMLDFDEIVLNLISDSILTNLNILYAFCAHFVRPLDTRSIVVVDNDGDVGVEFEEAKAFEDVGNLLGSLGSVPCRFGVRNTR